MCPVSLPCLQARLYLIHVSTPVYEFVRGTSMEPVSPEEEAVQKEKGLDAEAAVGAPMQAMQERRARMPAGQARGVATPKKLMNNVNLASIYQDQQLHDIQDLLREVRSLKVSMAALERKLGAGT